MRKLGSIQPALLIMLVVGVTYAAVLVPTDIQQPGTQPGEIGNLETPDKCDNCHGGYDPAAEPAHNWRGSMMANAGRDPLFWATLAVAEQDFDGVGDLCIRCHSTGGWLAGRSTPTDGSGLKSGDADGVECDFCHKITNPDNSEHIGAQNPPFVANDGGSPAVGYYGSGMYSVYGGNDKLGPYSDARARHQFLPSRFHRSVDFCGTCHDVSNPAVGDLAHNNGAQMPLQPGDYSGVPGSPITGKAAFLNFPYQYGVVERTYSEYKSGLISKTLVADYASLPAELKGGALKTAYERSIVAGTGGNYADGTQRYFSCQTCHMRPVTGQGCNKNPPVRQDLPLHDMTGGNYWMPDAIQYLDSQAKLRLGGGLTATQIAALNDGKARALNQLRDALSLSVRGNVLRVVNHTGHKLLSGYPEGRRMWLNIKWYDGGGTLLREDGKYGPMTVTLNAQPVQVNTILDLEDPNTKFYEAHYGMTQEWANQLLSLGYSPNLVLSYDRVTGAVDSTLGQLAAQAPGTYHETFHFVLNNRVAKDNRIPPYGMSYDEARARNALPVPANQYGNPGPGGVYNYWDTITLNPPAGTLYATIDMLYQPTSWEYVQFLYLANNGQNAFLANEGAYLLEAWQATGMAAPYVMASATWGAPLSGIRKSADDSSVYVSGKIVTGAFDGFFYVEEDDRSSGVRVQSAASVLAGTRVNFAGTVKTNSDGERYIQAGAVAASGTGFLDPLWLTNRCLGGGNWNYDPVTGGGQKGVKSGSCLNNIGLLVTCLGRVMFVGADHVYIDDGSAVSDSSGNLGVKVLAAGLALPSLGDYVIVTGISSCFKSGDDLYPLMRVRAQEDIAPPQ